MKEICKDTRKTCCDLYLGTDHVLLDKVIFEVLGSLERDTLTEVLKEIDSKLKDLDTKINFRTRMINLGKGEKIYKGYTLKNGNEFKTIVGGNGVDLTVSNEEIKFDIDFKDAPNRQDFDFRNIGQGIEVMESNTKIGDIFKANFRRIRSGDFSITKDSSESIVINYTNPDKVAIEELKNFTYTNYKEIVVNARKLANDKAK